MERVINEHLKKIRNKKKNFGAASSFFPPSQFDWKEEIKKTQIASVQAIMRCVPAHLWGEKGGGWGTHKTSVAHQHTHKQKRSREIREKQQRCCFSRSPFFFFFFWLRPMLEIHGDCKPSCAAARISRGTISPSPPLYGALIITTSVNEQKANKRRKRNKRRLPPWSTFFSKRACLRADALLQGSEHADALRTVAQTLAEIHKTFFFYQCVRVYSPPTNVSKIEIHIRLKRAKNTYFFFLYWNRKELLSLHKPPNPFLGIFTFFHLSWSKVLRKKTWKKKRRERERRKSTRENKCALAVVVQRRKIALEDSAKGWRWLQKKRKKWQKKSLLLNMCKSNILFYFVLFCVCGDILFCIHSPQKPGSPNSATRLQKNKNKKSFSSCLDIRNGNRRK